MKRLFAVFPSLNQAALVRRNLLNEGIFLEMCRTPECLLHTGCSFALKGDRQQMDKLEDVCKRITLSFRGVFEAEDMPERRVGANLSEEEL